MPNSFSGIGGWNVVDSEMRSISGDFATTTALNELAQVVANFGSYTTANGTGDDNHPDVAEPSMKTIYLVKDSSITTGDAYKEWICTNTTTPTYELIGDTQVDLSNYYLKTQTSGKQEIADALDLKQNIWSSAAISTLTTSYDIANNTVTKLENNNISDILEFNITGLSADEVPNVSIEFINNQADCYPVFKNNNVELLCNADTCYSGKSYMFRALGSMSEIIEMRTPRTNVSVNGTDVSVNGNLITP